MWDAGLAHANVSIDYPDAERHDGKRRLAGATDRAWHAVDILRDAAPRGGKQVHVMTVLMEDNWRDLEALLQQSAAHGVGHQVTLLSISGYPPRQGGPRQTTADRGVSKHVSRSGRNTLTCASSAITSRRIDAFLDGRRRCRRATPG